MYHPIISLTMSRAIAYLIAILSFCPWRANAQQFIERQLRDLRQMKHNYGNAVADYDQDGDLDLFIVAYDVYDRDIPSTYSRLLRNDGGWYTDVTAQVGLRDQYASDERSHKLGVAWGDYDNDGYPDLLLTHAGAVQLYHNDGGTFSDVTEKMGILPCSDCLNTSAMWWDYDRDGYLDLYVSNYVGANKLYHSELGQSFSEMSESSRTADDGSTWCSISFDFNHDGWLDLYVINDYGYSRMYLNREGRSFSEATRGYGLRNPGSAMGATIGDFDRDGVFDIYVTNIAELYPNVLLRGSAFGPYQEAQDDMAVGDGHWGWGTHLFDADHDGDEDIYLVNGFEGLKYENKFFKNIHQEGQDRFVEYGAEAQVDGGASGMSLEVFDHDLDGDLDMLISNTDDSPYFYENVGVRSQTHWLQVTLEGTSSNRDGLGTILIAKANGEKFIKYHHGANIMSQSIKPVHFGLGSIDVIDTLEVRWPSGLVDIHTAITTDRYLHITEGEQLSTSTKDISIELEENNQKAVYPNPVSDHIYVDNASSDDATLRLYSQTGRLLAAHRIPAAQTQIQIALPSLASSLSLIIYELISTDQKQIGKLIIDPKS